MEYAPGGKDTFSIMIEPASQREGTCRAKTDAPVSAALMLIVRIAEDTVTVPVLLTRYWIRKGEQSVTVCGVSSTCTSNWRGGGMCLGLSGNQGEEQGQKRCRTRLQQRINIFDLTMLFSYDMYSAAEQKSLPLSVQSNGWYLYSMNVTGDLLQVVSPAMILGDC